MARAGDEMAAAWGYFLASHADRGRVVDTLTAAFEEGRLTRDELDARTARALGSRTYAELAAVTADIPAGPAGAPRPRALNLTPLWWAIGVFSGIPPILLAAGVLADSENLAAAGLRLFVLGFVLAVMAGTVAIGTAVEARMENRQTPGPLASHDDVTSS